MRYLLVTQSKDVTTTHLEAILRAAVQACEPWCEAWDLVVPTIAVLESPTDVPPAGTVVATFRDADAGDGTLAFHFQQNGLPSIEIDVQAILRYGGGILDDAGTGLSVSGAFQHELFETEADRWAAAFVQRADGSFLALEVCDPCETFSTYYQVDGVGKVHGSDALLPAYFYEDATEGPYDLAGKVGEPYENDGYQITLPAPMSGPLMPARVEANHEAYTPNLWAYREERIKGARGRGMFKQRGVRR